MPCPYGTPPEVPKERKAIKDSLPDNLKEKPTLIKLLGKISTHPKTILEPVKS